MKKKSIYLLSALAAICFTLASCSDDDDATMSRLFRPVFSDIVAGLDENNVPNLTMTWDNYTSANQYVVKVVNTNGTDSTIVETDTTFVTIGNLAYDQDYNVHITARNTITGAESKVYTEVATTLDYPTQLKTVATTNIIDTQVRIAWNTTNGDDAVRYDQLVLKLAEDESVVAEYDLTEEDLAAGEHIFKNLNPTTEYRIEAYEDGQYRGKRLFKTTAPENYEGNVVDLRGMDDETAYKYLSTEVLDSIIALYPDQDITFVFEGGQTYRMPTLTLPATAGRLLFTTGLTLAGNTKFAVTGNFTAAAGATVGGLELQKIEFTDDSTKPKDSSNFGGTYLFNIGNAGCQFNDIFIHDCSIKYKRGICRIQTSAIIENLTIDNCIVDSIGGYGISNADNAAAEIRNVTLTNSTFSNVAVGLAATKGPNPETVTIENCTFAYCIQSGKYFIDFNGKTAKSIKLNNCLFGVSGATTKALAPLRAWRGNTAPQAVDLFFTKDLEWYANEDGSPVSVFDGTVISTDMAGTFKSPLTSDFTIINSVDFKISKPGDQRWY
ncbi:MAG: DUF4957 domain-containing protein [Prevotella sp.]